MKSRFLVMFPTPGNGQPASERFQSNIPYRCWPSRESIEEVMSKGSMVKWGGSNG